MKAVSRTTSAWFVVAAWAATGGAAVDGGDASGNSSGGLSPTAVAIIIVGAVVVLALLGILYWFLKGKHNSRPPVTARDDAPDAFFMTAFSPPSSQDKTGDYYSGSGMNIDGRTNRGPRVSAPTRAPYTGYGGQPRQPSEPILYNREATTTLRLNDSTRSYLYEPTTSPGQIVAGATPKIFSSKNSVDFNYPDTDRSNDAFDSSRSDLLGLGGADDSNRSNDSNLFGFVVDSDSSARTVAGYEDDSNRSRLATDDSNRSSRALDAESARTLPLNQDVETNALNTEEVEL